MYATVQELVDALTLEEKAGLCTGAAVPRLGLPALRVSGLHSQESAGGVCFPSACAAAASFDPEAARRMGAALGREARSGGAQLLEVPDVNLKRGPLSGRSADTWAEDPCLTGALAAAFLQGVQSAGVGGCAGRLAVVNQETDRRTLNRRVDERTLQELYLPAFETAVRDGQPRAVVCSAGQLNGTRICEDTALLTDTLRGAWGFAGAVLAEPGAVQDPARTLAAGVDFAPADAGRLVDAVQSGALDESVLNRAASNIIRTLLAASTQPSPADRTADRSLAVELAKQSGVLLRNLGALPLHKGQKVAYIGAFADHPRYSAGHPRAPQVTSAIDAAVLHGRKIHYIEGFPADRDQRDEAEFLRAVAAAEAADAAVIFAGPPE
ncbi:MAG: glycoside hydrolase family 3 protein, partial [Gemmiger sp.]|nr:glycoside hydrolase family 3 protein [Gemmiger sp.]